MSDHEHLFNPDDFLRPDDVAPVADYNDIGHIVQHLIEIGEGLACLSNCPFVSSEDVEEFVSMVDVTDRMIGKWTREALGAEFDPDTFLALLESQRDDGECDPED